IQEYVQSQHFPQKFSSRFIRQYKYYFKHVSVFDSSRILDSLPTTARTSLLFAQYHELIEKLSFLQASQQQSNNPPLFVARMVGSLNPSYAKAGDVLFYQNEVGSDLYFVITGKVNLFITLKVVPATERGMSSRTNRTNVFSDIATRKNPAGGYVEESFLLGKIFQDSLVGEVGVMLDLQQPCAAVAASQCDILTVNKEELLSALDGWLAVQVCIS
ncbi:unnamed protein product, partial [Choristocarpus tenellus]